MYHTPETLLNHVFEDLRKPKAPNSNKFRLQRERRPLAEGPKKHLPFARIANHSDQWGPPSCEALSINIEGYIANVFHAI
jgi:hypothetical protein